MKTILKSAQTYLLLILVLACLLRFINLSRIPSGFIPEEVSSGWNAYSILKTGRDEWGIFLPLVFRETGGYKLALNSYLIVPSIFIFGVNEFGVRFSTALAGVLTVFLTYVLTKQLFNSLKLALTSSLFLAISPWHIAVSRYGVDVNWGIPLFLLGLILFLKSLNKPNLLLYSGLSFALTYYTYFNFIVFTLLFIFGALLLKRNIYWAKNRFKLTLVFLAVQFVFLLPYITSPNLIIRFRQSTSVSQIGLVNRINEHRQACNAVYPKLVCRLFYNRVIERPAEFMRNYINHFSTTTFFLYGSKLGLSGMPDHWGLMYPTEFLFMAVGFWYLLRHQLFSPLLILWFVIYGLPSSLAAEGHIWRMLTVIPLPQIISAAGFTQISTFFKKKTIIAGGLILATSFFTFKFILDYTSYFPFAQGANSYYGFRDLYKYLAKIERNYDHIVVAPSGLGFEQLYIYYLFYMRPDPGKYQKGTDVERPTGAENWVEVKRIGKWRFVSDIRNVLTTLPDKTLFIGDGNFREKEPLPGNIFFPRLLHKIYYAQGDPAFKIMELSHDPTATMSSSITPSL